MAPTEHHVLVSVRDRMDSCEADVGVDGDASRVAGAPGDVCRLWVVREAFPRTNTLVSALRVFPSKSRISNHSR